MDRIQTDSEEFDPLPDQSSERKSVALTQEQKATEPPRWMNREQREAFYMRDLEAVFGKEYLTDSLEGQAVASNFKRSSCKEKQPVVRRGNRRDTESTQELL